MSTFQKNLQKFFVYFFTSLSLLVVILGVQRAKHSDAFGLTPAPEDDTSPSGAVGKTVKSPSQVITTTGKTFQTPWGNLATTIKVKDGEVIAVEVPTLPDSPPSIYAKPYLIDQALRSGSAIIQGVSGATITSRAFRSSLESAIAKATAQGVNISSANDSNERDLVYAPAPAVPPSTTNSLPVQQTTTTAQQNTNGVSGTFTGSPQQTPWGNAVASVTFTNGKITAVSMPQIPNSPPSIQAEPYLVQQALAAGSANIQGVSGATYASIAFKASLENAIAQASAQGTVTTPAANTANTSTLPSKPAISKSFHDDDEDDDYRPRKRDREHDRDDDDEWDD